MKTKFSRSLAALAGLTLLAFGAFAQTSQISGKVLGEDGQPLKDALIKIDRTDIKGSYKVKSNKKGEYLHAGLPLGQYTVSIEVDGKLIDGLTMKGVKTSMGDGSVVDFDLTKIKKRQEAAMASAQAGTCGTSMSFMAGCEWRKTCEIGASRKSSTRRQTDSKWARLKPVPVVSQS